MVAINQKKKKKKIGTDYFTFVFSQSKSEPRLFHYFAKFWISEFISLSSVCSKIYHFMKWKWFFEFIIAVSSDKYAVIFWSWSMYYIKMFFPSGWIECVVVQFYPWIKFYFLLFQTHCHKLPYTITKENKIQTKDKLNHNKYTITCII